MSDDLLLHKFWDGKEPIRDLYQSPVPYYQDYCFVTLVKNGHTRIVNEKDFPGMFYHDPDE